MVVFEQMAIFFLIMMLGYYVRSKNLITSHSHRQLTSLVVNFTAPLLILSCTLPDSSTLAKEQLLHGISVLCLLQVLMLASAVLLPILVRSSKDDAPVYNSMCVCTNIVFISMPVVLMIYGGEAMIYMAMFIVLNNIVFFSYNIFILTHGRGERFNFKAAFNPCLLSCLVLLFMMVFNLNLPIFLHKLFSTVGNISPALSMMLIGSAIYEISFRELFYDLRMWCFSVLKMIVVPIVIMYVIMAVTADRYLIGTCFVCVAAPSGVMVVMFTTLLRPGSLSVASRGISLTTTVSVLTIPLVGLACGIA
ncbi:MAG: AEC family transporter [Succinivibrio sp.]|nr:AEC family transporter [Succinivibrio sp.]